MNTIDQLKKKILTTKIGFYIKYKFFPKNIGLLSINWFFQRILRINKKLPYLVHFTSQVIHPEKIHIQGSSWKSLFLSGHLYLQGGNGIQIGKDCLIGPGVKIISANHKVINQSREWVNEEPIVIGDHCWIGANAVILPGVKIGNETVIGAGSIVTRNFPSKVVVVGNPGRIIKKLI